jgi:hypothetical protein
MGNKSSMLGTLAGEEGVEIIIHAISNLEDSVVDISWGRLAISGGGVRVVENDVRAVGERCRGGRVCGVGGEGWD